MGNKTENHAALEIDENYEYHVRTWRVKRSAWAFMFVVIGAGFGGFLGPGPFSKTQMQGPGGMVLEYERIARYNSPTQFRVTVPAGKNDVDLSINSEFLGKVNIERIDPEPSEMRLDGDRQTWTFARGVGDGPSQIRVTFRPEGFGSTPTHLAIRSVGEMNIKPFFLP